LASLEARSIRRRAEFATFPVEFGPVLRIATNVSPSPIQVHSEHLGEPLAPQSAPPPCTLILFGVTGDLARRKVIPALYHLALSGALPEPFAILGISRSVPSDEELRERLRESLLSHSRTPIDEDVWERFARCIFSVQGSVSDTDLYRRLDRRLEELARERGRSANRLYYLATPASAFPLILRGLRQIQLIRPVRGREPEEPWSRVIVEKPFGHDLRSAHELNELVQRVLDEDQVYRIDHYLGKETVQNILVFRFGNAIFEPLWNRRHIDHVQITIAEAIDVEGRGSFYEETGVVRDIVQNHMLQMLALCAMEPPVSFDAQEIRNMKSQVLRSLRPILPHEVAHNVVGGQYSGYLDEPGVAPDSRTATYVALRAYIDNWRWQGVPFYLRAGKALAARQTEISFHFRQIPFSLFGEENVCKLIDPNVLTIRIQPDEGIALHIASKVPGDEMGIGGVTMDFQYAEAFQKTPPDAYERLLLDAIRGDATLFARKDEVELSWKFVDPILEAWADTNDGKVAAYEPGTAGPREADALLARDGRRWRRLRG